ncbi:MAG: hypothetical protein IIZ92_25370, partial [Aquincola sp.]|nr:hypothetical protein [Aquincola sp.]
MLQAPPSPRPAPRNARLQAPFTPHLTPHLTALAAAVLLAACGGSDDGDDTTAPPPPAPAPTVACSVDTSVALAYEEQRLQTPLPFSGANVVGSNATPLADRILKDTGFDSFAPAFATKLCGAGGTTTVTSYAQAV